MAAWIRAVGYCVRSAARLSAPSPRGHGAPWRRPPWVQTGPWSRSRITPASRPSVPLKSFDAVDAVDGLDIRVRDGDNPRCHRVGRLRQDAVFRPHHRVSQSERGQDSLSRVGDHRTSSPPDRQTSSPGGSVSRDSLGRSGSRVLACAACRVRAEPRCREWSREPRSLASRERRRYLLRQPRHVGDAFRRGARQGRRHALRARALRRQW